MSGRGQDGAGVESAARLVRRAVASDGDRVARKLDAHAPPGVLALRDQRYGAEADMLLDVFRPASADGPLPTVVWVHGGGWLGGTKEGLAGYFRLVAGKGSAVVGPRDALAPEHRYPTPTRQVMGALGYLQAHAERLDLDPDRTVVAGSSAGAQIAAQVGALVTTPGYSDDLGIAPTITPRQLRGLVLACGPYDLGLARSPSRTTGRGFLETVLWAYSGQRGFLEDPLFATGSAANHATSAFPPTLITVGNADPLRPHSELMAERLRAQGLEPRRSGSGCAPQDLARPPIRPRAPEAGIAPGPASEDVCARAAR